MNPEVVIEKSRLLHKHLEDLYQTANVLPWIPDELLPEAFKQLYITSKIVKSAVEEIYQQNEELIKTRNLLETEHYKYKELFEFAPIAYFVTNQQGIIQIANPAAAELLNISPHFISCKPLINFIASESHQYFYEELWKVCQSSQVREINLLIKPRDHNSFNATLRVKSIINHYDKTTQINWVIYENSTVQTLELPYIENLDDLEHNLPKHKYCKGENIPLHPQLIWYVNCGLVKLSTFSETGEEITTGLITKDMVFGSDITSLQIYQATSLVDVELLSINKSQLDIFPLLKELILSKLQERLKQTEYFLFINGQRNLETRLLILLKFVQQLIGEPVPSGKRLAFHLTHEDIAGICGTTRVTITRLMGILRKKGIITIDARKHIILKKSY